MWTQTAEARRLVQETAKQIVLDVAPEELDLFDELVAEYFRNPNPAPTTTSSNDDPLGFGIDEAIMAVTPAAAAVTQAILQYITTDLLKVAREETAETVRARIKILFKMEQKEDKQEKDDPAPLTREQLEQVKKLARRQAIKFGMSAEKAEKMANALIGLLVLQ